MRKDWEEIAFGDLCKFSQGVQVPKGKQYSENNADRVRFLRIVDFTQGNEEPRYIEKPDDSNIVTKEDISMVRYGTVGFVCTGKEGAIANNLFRVIPKIDIENSYLINYLKSSLFKRYLNSKGATMQALSFGLIKPIKIPLPSIPEQEAIVAKIEQLLSDLDKGVADLKKAKDQLKIYRQAVLKKAFEGGLTKKWRENRKLKLQQWHLISFGKATNNFDGKRRPLSRAVRKDFQGIYPYYGACEHIDNVKEYIFDGKFMLIGEDGANLLSKSKPLSFIVEGKFWVNNHAHVIQPKDGIDISFLNHQFNSLHINEFVTGTAQPKLNQRNLNKIPVKIPSIDEQHQIVQEIESRLSVCDKVEEIITQSLGKAEVLRHSILKKAFQGRLLSDEELEKCKTALDYEPASVLLEKIKNL